MSLSISKGENMQNKDKKRQRSENWLEEDKRLLIDLVKERVSAIENKNTDTNTNSKKQTAWTDLLISFNSMCRGGPRTIPQLKTQWGVLKMTQKKLVGLEKKGLIKTGGGPPVQLTPEFGEDIRSWLPLEFTIDYNEFDSDQINRKKNDADSNMAVKEAFTIEDAFTIEPVAEVITSAVDNITVETVAVNNILEIDDTDKAEVRPKSYMIKKRRIAPKAKLPENKNKNYAKIIAETEIDCRMELHRYQVENEIKKARNLDLMEELLKTKINNYKKTNVIS